MKRDPSLIDRPAPLAVRLIALAFLDEADDGRRRLLAGDDAEALHDVRVALRRLRSLLRAYPRLFTDSVRRGDRRRLRALAAVTGRARDLEVQLGRLRGLTDLTAAEAEAVEWLVASREEARATAFDEVRRRIGEDLPAAGARLRRRLRQYRLGIDPDDPDALPPSFAIAAAGPVLTLGARLESRLADVHGKGDQRVAHQARIVGKRLRYVLEPLAAGMPAAASLVRRLKDLQDRLGDMHDADLLKDEVERLLAEPPRHGPPEAGLRALCERFGHERGRLFERARDEWFGAAAAPFFEDVRRLTRELRRHAAADTEIERKFLLNGMPRLGRRHVTTVHIEQGWLPGDRLQERLRRVRNRDGTRWFRTVKSGRGIRRTEIEEETTQALFRRLWRLTRGRRVRKRRYVREHDGLVWEIDRFLDRDLVLAEVELPAADTPVSIPPWLEDHIVREVTGEDAYANVNLAM